MESSLDHEMVTARKKSLTRIEKKSKMVSNLTFCFATQSLTNVSTCLTKMNAKLHEM